MTTESPPAPSVKKNPLESFERFMRTVRSACATPGGRAALRDGLAEELSSPWRLYMHLLPAGGIPSYAPTREAELPYLLVACLYAVHDAPNPRTAKSNPPPAVKPAEMWQNLGWSYARAARTGAMRRENAADALSHLAELGGEDLYRELPGAISLLRSQQIPVKWPVLLRDLTRWPKWADDVRVEWARAFHTPTIRTAEEKTK
ncbi:type I-E CRISPR-associated protein Cse2/CasB [Streptomyces akebiae]|uniref:Type I-E CRISPR-associated protein Cse2/CasB n=1 Tax=Streptomyces akebiae TaxID=2865673 RepID=A0ABX8XSY5_9ACTN|nr:type I-E CRISPR-associated protein Cse2/CasB [Streptomyces akebiae]QYX79028.1 type I-E CRISPR-associated protein Cse2/CasB [Streptomyces akebiae]